MPAKETAFTMDTSSIKFGPGVTRELGHDMRALGARRVMVVTDRVVAELPVAEVAVASLREAHVDAVLFDGVRIEPTDASFRDAIEFAQQGGFDGFVGLGGGSSIDTAKAANLYATHPDDFLAYVNAPIGSAKPVPGPLKPLIAVPTTAGTGSETTGVAIFDLVEMRAKTGIAHRALRPRIGIIDPDNTRTMPKAVAASSAMDILCHAVESLTALPYHEREAPAHPGIRPAYQGANPISDVWAAKAVSLVATSLPRALADPDDDDARAQMLLAATYAGIGFGNAGVHLPHGMSYAISGLIRGYRPDGYLSDHPLVPHGMSVILGAPAAFRFTAQADSSRHLWAARLLGADVADADPAAAGEILAAELIRVMRQVGMPNGLGGIGYTEADAGALAEGTLPQHRVTKLSPRQADRQQLVDIFRAAMSYW